VEVTAYIAFGSNVGDRHSTMKSALARLDALERASVIKVSEAIETAPVGGPASQDAYLNAAMEIRTSLAPARLLESLHDIERSLGRNRELEPRWGPRTCDLDILLMGDMVVDTPELIIPHPLMHQRRFVLAPLVMIAPHAWHPVLEATASELLARLEARK